MKNKIKKWHIALMSFVALMFAIFTSLFSLKANPVDDETGEILTDNWEISTVFYDSTVNNGATPLTEINWDASDGSYKEGTPRVIKIQITYKNNSAIKTYQPGELIIKIPQLSLSNVSPIINIGANDDSHTGYDWTFLSDKYSSGTYLFSNAITFEKDSNFEGSIQTEYTYTPHEERYIERYENECLHETFKEIQAELLFLSNDFEC